MSRRTVIVVVVAVMALAVVWMATRGGTAPPAVDLLAQFPSAQKAPSPDSFRVAELSVNDELKPGVVATGPTRIIWKLTLPNDPTLHVSMAVDPQVWEKEGDGVLFMVGISDGRRYEPLVEKMLVPNAVPEDRAWMPVSVDLSAWSGQQVEIIFNTRASAPKSPAEDRRNDIAFWGSPAIYLR